MIAIGFVLAVPAAGRCDQGPDLEAAFIASFGHASPLTRTVTVPIHDGPDAPKRVGTRSVSFGVRPNRLVDLGDHEVALVSYEVDEIVAHAAPGAIAISYLGRTSGGWVPRHLWPELLTSGVGGQPANAGAELHRFAGDPLFFARSARCGMGECSEWIGVIRMSRAGPVAYDDILAGAASPTGETKALMKMNHDCESYALKARIEPPRRRGSLFSVRYDGWTAPPGTLFPKKPLHLVTDFVPDGTRLVMQPAVPVPTCGR